MKSHWLEKASAEENAEQGEIHLVATKSIQLSVRNNQQLLRIFKSLAFDDRLQRLSINKILTIY